jgi:ubiquinone/menaquinone biosynthesis C-methylase UbiE
MHEPNMHAGAQASALGRLLRTPLPMVQDGIFDAIGDAPEPPMPSFYDDESYRQMTSRSRELHDSHYNSGSVSGRIERAMKTRLAELMDPDGDDPIIDLGCGIGSGFEHFGGADRIIGVDTGLDLLRQARRAFPDATLVRARLDDLPFRPRSLKAAVASGVLEHVFDLETAMRSIATCMAPEGRFYVLVPTEGGPAWSATRFVASYQNAPVFGLSPAEARRVAKIEHCNTVFGIENAMRKFFIIESTNAWPFNVGGTMINLTKNYRLRVR